MTTRWIDPFLEATTQGNGTTDTSTRNGTYAAPFSISDFYFTSSTAGDNLNSVTLSDGDELRIKGLPFTTLFESYGNVYTDTNSNGGDGKPKLLPVNGNSNDFTISTSKSSLFAFQNSDIANFLPNWTHPLFFAAFYTGTSTQLECCLGGPFVLAVIKLQLGYDAATDTGIEVFRLKDTYANIKDLGSSRRYWGIFNKEVTVSAGGTSETAQEGYSTLDYYHTSNYQYSYWAYSSNKTVWNAERLVSCHAPRASGGYNNNLYLYFNQNTYNASTHVTPMFVQAAGRGNSYHGADYLNGDSTTFPLIAGNDDSVYSNMSLDSQSYRTATRTTIYKNIIIGGYPRINSNHVNNDLKFGNMYNRASRNTNATDGSYNRQLDENSSSNVRGKKVTFLQNSVYFSISNDSSKENILFPVETNLDYNGITGSITYESGLKKPGIAPLNNLPVSSTYGPTRGGTLAQARAFKETKDVSANNDWFALALTREGQNPIVYGSLGKLTCNSADFRTTAHNITYNTKTALSATAAPEYVIWSGEHNDYDGKPLSLITDPYTAGTSYASLLYNDVISSVGVLVGQWAGTTGGASNDAYIPLELAVPSYTAGSDNLRVTVSAAYSNGGGHGAQQKIKIKAHHRDTTQSDNFRVYTSGDTTISSSDPASPTTATLYLTNVQTSGQERITSVIVGIKLQFANNTNIQKFYISNAAIETY